MPVAIVQLEIQSADGKSRTLNCSREPRLAQLGSGDIVVECIGSLVVDGMAGGMFQPTKPFVVTPDRITMIRRFEQ